MNKLLLLLGFLVLLGSALLLKSCNKPPLLSRQQEKLSIEQYQNECNIARDSVLTFYKNPRKFASFWQSTGDVYQSAVRLLDEYSYQDLHIKAVFRYKSAPAKILVELESENCPNLIVSVWTASQNYTVTEMYLANEGERNE